MELQRRQRLETALRFQKHLEKVYLYTYFFYMYNICTGHLHIENLNFYDIHTYY